MALGTTLAGRGVPVLALDLTGFGESENPAVPLAEAPRLELDVLEAAGYAVERGLTREGRYAYVGHSLGAGVVLAAGQLEPRPLCIVGLGTPVAAARLELEGEAWLEEFSAQRLRDMEIALDERSIASIARYLLEIDPHEQVLRPGRPPLLFVRGGIERPYGIQHLRSYLPDERTGIVEFAEIPDAGHYYGIRAQLGHWVFHDPTVTEQLTDRIDEWIHEWDRPHSTRGFKGVGGGSSGPPNALRNKDSLGSLGPEQSGSLG